MKWRQILQKLLLMENVTHLVNFVNSPYPNAHAHVYIKKTISKCLLLLHVFETLSSTETLATVTKYGKFNFCGQLKNLDASKCLTGNFLRSFTIQRNFMCCPTDSICFKVLCLSPSEQSYRFILTPVCNIDLDGNKCHKCQYISIFKLAVCLQWTKREEKSIFGKVDCMLNKCHL